MHEQELRKTIDRFSKSVKHHRQSNGMTQNELSGKSGVNIYTLRYYERGRVMPTLYHMISLARAFDITLDELAGWKREKEGDVDG